mmetsp:Transcript_9107/g.20449  ORF Transcript_9107/g.20449 Transcript_9107/m.20449 type:complete len:140 (+) Transcript_9107:148-567(+)
MLREEKLLPVGLLRQSKHSYAKLVDKELEDQRNSFRNGRSKNLYAQWKFGGEASPEPFSSQALDPAPVLSSWPTWIGMNRGTTMGMQASAPDPTEQAHNLPFVMTNPDMNLELKDMDCVFIVGTSSLASRSCDLPRTKL